MVHYDNVLAITCLKKENASQNRTFGNLMLNQLLLVVYLLQPSQTDL